MSLGFPWALFGLLVVAAAAVLALIRPARRRLIVPSLTPWLPDSTRKTRPARRYSLRVVLSWLLLLLGATAAVFAAARPVMHAEPPRRYLAVGVINSAELDLAEGGGALHRWTAELLERLSPADRVQLLLPAVAGGASDWMSPSEARRRLERLEMLPVRADEPTLPEPSPPGEYSVVFAPVGANVGPPGPRRTVVELPAEADEAIIESVSAEVVADGRAELFIAVRNPMESPRTVGLNVTSIEPRDMDSAVREELRLAAGDRRGLVLGVPPAGALAVQLNDGDHPAARAYLARRRRPTTNVAVVGQDEPAVRRFVAAADWLEEVADPGQADVVIANAVEPPDDVPALVVAPPSPPPGTEPGTPGEHVRLEEANVRADDPVMRHVDLRGVVVRRLEPWTAPAQRYLPLVSIDGEAVILRDAPGPLPQPGRVYVAFSLDAENTNFTVSEAFVLFLAGAVEYLADDAGFAADYESMTPLEAGPGFDMEPLYSGGRHASGLPLPGIYADEDGLQHAVSLTGLVTGRPDREPVEVAAEAPLPDAVTAPEDRELWPVLAVAAVAFWLAGWVLRKPAI